MGLPSTREDIEELVRRNIGLIVTLNCDEVIEGDFISGQLPQEILSGFTIRTLYLPINPNSSPTFEQVNEFIEAVDETKRIYRKATVVHCEFGKSRTGTMLACWLIKKKGYSAQKAINKVALEASLVQKDFIRSYYVYIHNHNPVAVVPVTDLSNVPPGPMAVAGEYCAEEAASKGFVLDPLPFSNRSLLPAR
jgi:hypothetical protein